MEMFEGIKVGDKIWSLRRGWITVVEVNLSKPNYPIKLIEPNGSIITITMCGRYRISDIKPTFFWSEPKYEIPPRPKRKVKKAVKVWVNIYPNNRPTNYWYKTKEHADHYCIPTRIACVECTGEYEVEE